MDAKAYDDDDRPDELDENEFAGEDTYVKDDFAVVEDDDSELEANDFLGEDTFVEGVFDDDLDDEGEE